MRIPVNVNEYAEWLDRRKRFVQINYGDGEWSCILGLKGGNVNGETYNEKLRQALINTLVDIPRGIYLLGSNPGRGLRDAVEQWLLENHLEQRSWVYKEILSGANVNGKLKPFIEAVRKHTVVLLGPAHLKNEFMYKLWNIKQQVISPTVESYTADQMMYENSVKAVRDTKATLFLGCAGMGSKPALHRLSKVAKDCIILDIGACLDPYVGVWSRKNYRKEIFQKDILPENYRGII